MKNITLNNANNSALNYNWQEKEFCSKLKKQIQEKFSLANITAQILANRFDDLDIIDNFVNATLKHNLSDPFALKDMKKGVDLVVKAILENKKIVIFADYDVDGASSAALFKNYFKLINKKIGFYIPDRIKEGYGPNSKALLSLKEQQTDLVITVDCGTSSFEPLEEAAKVGLDVIVIDHHLGGKETPQALAVINPNRHDETSKYTYLCAAGVSFLFLIALNKTLREQNYFLNRAEPNLLNLLDLAALGTVCDVVPLLGLNRAIVKQGLKIMRQDKHIGLKALANIANYDVAETTSYHLGFVIGPRINAGGRVAVASLGTKLLTSANYEEAYEISEKLELHNRERKALEQQVLQEALEIIAMQKLAEKPVIIAVGENWHIGVIGIVASRIKEQYNLPVAIISFNDDIGKSSCRSIKGVDFGSAITKAGDLLVAGGGHKMAAGFTIKRAKLQEFSQYLQSNLSQQVKIANKNKILAYDVNLPISALNVEFIEKLAILEPYGQDNAEPKFMIDNCKIFNLKEIGTNHYKLRLVEANSGVYGISIDAVIWKAKDTPLGNMLLQVQQQEIAVIALAKLNKWQNKTSVQLQILDIKLTK